MVAHVLLLPESPRRSWWGDLAVLLAQGSRRRRYTPPGYRPLTQPAFQSPGRALFSSALLHVAAVVLLLHMPAALLVREATSSPQIPKVIYHLSMLDDEESLPTLKSSGPGGAPGSGNRPDRAPALGSTAFHKRWTIVSNPPNPDNNRQTIIQPLAPPEIRIPYEVSVPNLLLGGASKRLRRPLDFAPSSPAPLQKRPQLESASEPPRLSSQQSDADLSLLSSNITNPNLPVPPPADSAPAALPNGAQEAPASNSSSQSQPLAGGDAGFLALSLGNVSSSPSLTLPLGNRYGAFSVSPAGSRLGSPGGVEGGDPQGGTGGGTNGGDSSTGVGSGSSSGGAGSSGNLADLPISLHGDGNGGSSPNLTLHSTFTQGQMFPVVFHPRRLRTNALVISTGPVGGGGLQVYGVLRGGKIHTVYLPMPGKNWILQYCLLNDPVAQGERPATSVRVQVDQGLAAPFPTEGFDFKRPKLVRETAQPYIILHGVIAEDGSVRRLRVYQSVQPDADQLALAAFSRWKFQPALRAAKPTAVEVLVGIPGSVPQK